MKHVFIVNPHAGKKDRRARIYEMADALRDRHGLDCSVMLTDHPGGATGMARKLAESGEEVRIYACGGDGTIHEVANGIAGFPNAAMTCIPIGTGNDFLKNFGSDAAKFTDAENLWAQKTLRGALGFVLGFTIVFVAMGALAGTVGSFLKKYQTAVNIVSGLIVIIFGLNFLGVLKLNLFRGGGQMSISPNGFFSSVLFGIIFSVGWTPCVGAFLGSALMLASQQGHVLEGMLMLLVYSLGLGIPFLVSALLIDKLKSAFNWIKSHYDLVNKISGALPIFVGVLMATGTLGRFLTWMS